MKIRRKMCDLSESQKSDEEAKVNKHVISFLDAKPIGRLLAYAAFPPELSIDPVIVHALEKGWTVSLPRITKLSEGMMDLHKIESLDDLITNAMGIREPMPESTCLIEPAAIDIGLIPAWAYDRKSGARLGKGGGFYDRLLANPQWRAQTYGIGYRCQLSDHIPVEPHDKSVEGVFNPDGLLNLY